MRLCLPSTACGMFLVGTLLGLGVVRPATARSGEVRVLAGRDGASLRITGPAVADCAVIQSEPPRFIVSIRGADLESRVLPNRSEWLRSVRVLGAEMLGGLESRLIIETASTLLQLRIESAPGGVAIVIEGNFEGAGAPAAEEEQPEASPAPEPAPDASPTPEPTPEPPRARRARAPKISDEPAPGATPTAPTAPEPGRATQPWREDVAGMRVIPGGEFVMGAVEGTSFADESPQHVVRLSAFRIDSREVTVAEFSSSPIPMPRQPEWSQDQSNPVVNVTWHEAAEYCEWRDKRLPTEAEWERAARGADRRTYPWGMQWSPTRANSAVDGDGFSHLAPVGALADGAAAEGALDLSGNAWEWTADWYRKDTYEGWRGTNPSGPRLGGAKTCRGGSFRSSSASTATSTVRLALPPSTRRDDVGFRCASSN